MEAVRQGGEPSTFIFISGEIVSVSHNVRVTVRCHVGEFRKEADLALPVSSSFNELVTEVTDFIGAPSVTRPWRVTTAAGRPIDQSASLSATQLVDGSVVLLSPTEEIPAPVIRDSTEALVSSSSSGSPRGIVLLWTVVALIAAGGVGGFLSGQTPAQSTALAALIIAIGAAILAVWKRQLPLGWLIISSASLAAASSVAGWPVLSVRDFSFGLYAAALMCAIVALACRLLNIAHARTLGAAGVISPMLLLAGLTAPRSGGAIIAATIIVLAWAPGLATMIAGLRVPQLPTAGQDLAVSDELVDNVDQRSSRAHFIYEGLCIGLSIAAAIALGYLCLTSAHKPIISTLLFLMLCAAVVLHAGRHRHIMVQWSLSMLACLAALGAPLVVAVADFSGHVHPILWIIACLPILAAIAAPWWVPRISRVSPTMIQWYERIEAAALVLCLPMSAHLAGLFEFIRGLG